MNPTPPNTMPLPILQQRAQEWREKNFPPEHRTLALQALGVAEECGELSHAVLKMEQGIRGTEMEHRAAIEDAMGDIIIYMTGIASNLGVSLQACVDAAWYEVAQRDWTKYKQTGAA